MILAESLLARCTYGHAPRYEKVQAGPSLQPPRLRTGNSN